MPDTPTEAEPFGALADGTVVHRYTLDNGRGLVVRVLTYGGILQTIEVPDRDGRPANVALGFGDLDSYVRDNTPYFGAQIGRYANRIAGGRFTLDGRGYALPVNNPPNSLHGGTEGFDKRVWAAIGAPGLLIILPLPFAKPAVLWTPPPTGRVPDGQPTRSWAWLFALTPRVSVM